MFLHLRCQSIGGKRSRRLEHRQTRKANLHDFAGIFTLNMQYAFFGIAQNQIGKYEICVTSTCHKENQLLVGCQMSGGVEANREMIFKLVADLTGVASGRCSPRYAPRVLRFSKICSAQRMSVAQIIVWYT